MGILLLLVLLCGAAKGGRRRECDDLQRLRQQWEKIHREEILPFE